MASLSKPTLFIIAGPNGAGKSTIYELMIKPKVNVPFINADIIQRDELKTSDPGASYEAARIAEARRQEFLRTGKSFVSETVFSHESKLALLATAKAAGFRIAIYHVNVRSEDLSVARVRGRVKQGGHDVPEDKIRARYQRNQPLIRAAVRLADRAHVYDNSIIGKTPLRVLSMTQGRVDFVAQNVPAWARALYKEDLLDFSPARQNAASHSYYEVKRIAQALGGESVRVEIPKPDTSYPGQIIGESQMHWLQQTDNGTYVAHFKSSLSDKVGPGQYLQISYASRNLAKTDMIGPPDHPPLNDPDVLRKLIQAIDDPRRRAEALQKLSDLSPVSQTIGKADDFDKEQ